MNNAARFCLLAVILLALACAAAAAPHNDSEPASKTQMQAASETTGEIHDGHDATAAGTHEQHEEHYELPNFMMYIHAFNRDGIDGWLAGINANLPPLLRIEWLNIENLTYCLIVIALLSAMSIGGTRRRALRPTSRLYIFLETMTVSLHDFFAQVLGSETRKYIAFVGTLFVYILCLNLFGLIPLMKSPTSVWGINFAMALCVFLYVQYTAVVRNGFLGYMKHLVGEPWWLFPLMVPLHIIEELIKPISLSLRLFGNILGEDTLLAVFAGLIVLIPGVLNLPLQFPFMFLAMLFSTIQALIFSTLAAVYIALMLPHEEHAT